VSTREAFDKRRARRQAVRRSGDGVGYYELVEDTGSVWYIAAWSHAAACAAYVRSYKRVQL